MKKCVLSAIVTSLLVPMAYGMDHGAAPAVEVELPAVVDVPVEIELPAVSHVPVVEVEVPAIETPPVDAPGVETPGVDAVTDPINFDLTSKCVFPTDEDGNPAVCICPEGPSLGRPMTLPFDENGDPVDCFYPGTYVMRLDENGEIVCEGVDPVPVDENGDPVVFYSFGSAEGGELPHQAFRGLNNSLEASSGAADENRSEEGSAIRNLMSSGLLSTFRSSVSDRGPEIPAAGTQGEAHAADSSQINAGQRGTERSTEHRAERSLRASQESDKSHAGIGKFLGRFRQPNSEVTPASAIPTDTALSSQLAGIDRLRDTALRTGDQKLLDRADKLEQQLRAKSENVTRSPTRKN